MLTAKGEEQDRVRGLDLGADDYLVKPFSATELLARVRAVLRRSQMPSDVGSARVFTHGDLKIDFARAEVWNFERTIADDGYVIIKFWLHISKEEQKRRFKKLEKDPHSPIHIVTRSGLGYLMPPFET